MAPRLIAVGCTNRSVAVRLHLSETTIKTHLSDSVDKIGANDRAASVRVAYQRGLLCVIEVRRAPESPASCRAFRSTLSPGCLPRKSAGGIHR
ncbi:LuxR C-terminal-related transcriptional regulator [Citricoccus nitrophenolicus]